MTQKEYNENLLKLEEENKRLRSDLVFEKNKNLDHEQLLEDYHRVSEELRTSRRYEKENIATIERLNATVEQYEKILNRFTINC